VSVNPGTIASARSANSATESDPAAASSESGTSSGEISCAR